MKGRTLTLCCDGLTSDALAAAIRGFSDAAYPPGGSECAQAARAALLQTAAACEAHQGGNLMLRKRQLGLLRTSVRWYFSEDGPGDVESLPSLESLLAANNKSTS